MADGGPPDRDINEFFQKLDVGYAALVGCVFGLFVGLPVIVRPGLPVQGPDGSSDPGHALEE